MDDVDAVVLHDEFMSVGGAENVAVAMAEILDCTIYTSKKSTDHYDDKVDIVPLGAPSIGNPIIDEVLSGFPFYRLSIPDADVVVSTGDRSKLFRPKANQTVINYTHTPTRWVYDLQGNIVSEMGLVKASIFRTVAWFWDRVLKHSLKNVDVLLCNSPIIQERIRKYWTADARVLFPPIDTGEFRNEPDEGYYLWINRLLPRKRPDVVLDAFERSDATLKVVGTGMEKFVSRAQALDNVEYLGQVSEEEKRTLLARCRALIYVPIEEDFGIGPIEAFASGKPVIGVQEGFTEYQIEEGINGVFAEPTPGGILRATERITSSSWDAAEIRHTSLDYDIENFQRKLETIIKSESEMVSED